MKNYKSGFTLVELSIVIVIIGLLIGGILVGKSLIESAKVNSEARKIVQYSIAIVNFKQKFKQEAGDSNRFSPAGNNNGTSFEISGTCPTNALLEFISAWSHLVQAGMLKESYNWSATNYCNNNFKNISPYATLPTGYSGVIQPFYIVSNSAGYSQANQKYLRYFHTHYPYQTLMALDKKLDDGLPNASLGTFSSLTYDGDYTCDQTGAQLEANALGMTLSDIYCSANIYFSPLSSPELPITSN